jgi:glutamyl/glutaminyl-tRNA synthetase
LPPPGVEKADFFPLAKRLPTTRARQPALRYYVNRFPTFYHFQAVRNAAAGRTTSKRVRTVLSSIEEEAVQDLKVMDKLTLKKREVAPVVKALETPSTFVHKGMLK